MACDIGERLLGDSEEVGLGIHVEAPLILEITSNFHPGPLGEPLRQPAEAGREPEVVEGDWGQTNCRRNLELVDTRLCCGLQ